MSFFCACTQLSYIDIEKLITFQNGGIWILFYPNFHTANIYVFLQITKRVF